MIFLNSFLAGQAIQVDGPAHGEPFDAPPGTFGFGSVESGMGFLGAALRMPSLWNHGRLDVGGVCMK